jgi:hypothetical protein
MKYLIIPYISLGFVLSIAIGIEYNCTGKAMFPTFYGSPFVFKKESLGSSMEYFYNILGLMMCVLTWSILLYIINKAIKRLIKEIENKWVNILYKIVIGIMIAFTTLNVAMDSVTIGRGFEKGFNYWYWDIDKEAENWGMTCKGELMFFRK